MLYDYQENDLWRIVDVLREKQSVLFEACVSYGKTYLACEFIKHCIEWDYKVIFCVNREQLVFQALNDFSEIKEHVSVLKSGYEHLFNKNKPVQIVMLHSYNAKKHLLEDFEAKIVMIDECHLFYGGVMMSALLKQFSEAKIIGISGTCIDEKGYRLSGFDDYLTTITMKELIERGFLAKPVYYASIHNYSLDNIKIKGNDYDMEDLEQYILDVSEVSKIVKAWREHALNKKTIIFASSVKHANKIKDEFEAQGFNAYVLHSNIINLNEYREALLNDFRAGRKNILINVQMLVEGFSDTEVECILFACPTRILRKYIQSAGRGFRRSKTKTECIFLDCCGVFALHGLPDDFRFYQERQLKDTEPKFKECAECGAILDYYVEVCPFCEYDFRLEPEAKTKQTKKQLERLVKIKSMQDEAYNEIKDLVRARGHKSGYSWHLFKGILTKSKNNGRGIAFYKSILTKIDKCKNSVTKSWYDNNGVFHEGGKPYSLQWLLR